MIFLWRGYETRRAVQHQQDQQPFPHLAITVVSCGLSEAMQTWLELDGNLLTVKAFH